MYLQLPATTKQITHANPLLLPLIPSPLYVSPTNIGTAACSLPHHASDTQLEPSRAHSILITTLSVAPFHLFHNAPHPLPVEPLQPEPPGANTFPLLHAPVARFGKSMFPPFSPPRSLRVSLAHLDDPPGAAGRRTSTKEPFHPGDTSAALAATHPSSPFPLVCFLWHASPSATNLGADRRSRSEIRPSRLLLTCFGEHDPPTLYLA